jgi:hypothetical protein
MTLSQAGGPGRRRPGIAGRRRHRQPRRRPGGARAVLAGRQRAGRCFRSGSDGVGHRAGRQHLTDSRSAPESRPGRGASEQRGPGPSGGTERATGQPTAGTRARGWCRRLVRRGQRCTRLHPRRRRLHPRRWCCRKGPHRSVPRRRLRCRSSSCRCRGFRRLRFFRREHRNGRNRGTGIPAGGVETTSEPVSVRVISPRLRGDQR